MVHNRCCYKSSCSAPAIVLLCVPMWCHTMGHGSRLGKGIESSTPPCGGLVFTGAFN